MQTIVNLGTGGADLNGQNGSTTSADSNDALFLDWPGDNAGNYVYLPGVAGNYLSVPDEAALDITGDIDIRVYCAMEDWTKAQVIASKWGSVGNRSYIFKMTAAGVPEFQWTPDGSTATTRTCSAAFSVIDGEPLWVRVTMDVDNGAGGYDLKWFQSDDGVSWTQVGSTITGGATTSIYASTQVFEVGSYGGGAGFQISTGRFYRAQVLDGIGGTLVLDVDCSQITSGADTSFTAATGQTVTINRSTSGRKAVAVVSPVWLFGTDDYMEVAANALLGADPSQDFTAMIIHRVWDTPASSGTKLSTTIPGVAAGRVGFNIRHLTTTYQTQNYWQDATNAPNDVLDAGLAPSSGDLSVMGFVVDRGEQRIRGFSELGIDSVGADITAVGSTVTSNVFRIARVSQGGGAFSDMEVIGVAVFRRALSFSEISQVYSYYQNRAA